MGNYDTALFARVATQDSPTKYIEHRLVMDGGFIHSRGPWVLSARNEVALGVQEI